MMCFTKTIGRKEKLKEKLNTLYDETVTVFLFTPNHQPNQYVKIKTV